MNQWVKFFIGTPQRFLVTMAGLLVLASLADPGIPGRMAQGIVALLSPFIGIGITIVIIVLVLKGMVGGFRK